MSPGQFVDDDSPADNNGVGLTVKRFFATISIEWKLPLVMCSLLLIVIAALSYAAYSEVARSARHTAEGSLERGVSSLAGTWLQGEVEQVTTRARLMAAEPAIRTFIHYNGRGEAGARAALNNPGRDPLKLVAVQLRDAKGHLLLSTGPLATLLDPDSTEELIAAVAESDSSDEVGVGGFRQLGDSIAFPTVATIDEAGARLGTLVLWRYLSGTLQLTNTDFFVGTPGGTWTDLTSMVPAPPVDVTRLTRIVQYERPGAGSQLVAAASVAGAPWVALLEMPQGAMLAPVNRFLSRLALIAGVLFAIGLLGAWILSRRITGPLRQLTLATDAISGGNYSGRVQIDREDELGHLATGFNLMAARVEESQQRLEERVKSRTAELLERNQEMEAFGYSISHDLRAPLRSMQGFSRILLEDYGDRLDDTGREHALRVVNAAKRMDQLIQDLLAYSRVSRAELKVAPVELAGVVREALTQLEAELNDRKAKVHVHGPLPAVLAHEATLSQVVANLVGNGIKFVAPGKPPEVKVRAERNNGSVRLWIEDNGIGIASEHLNRVFGVFDRLHTVEEYPGTGIGLAIVKKGVERMGGRVGVQSAVGRGSQFWIELPSS